MFSRVAYKEMNSLEQFDSVYSFGDMSIIEFIDQGISQQEGVTPIYISVEQGDISKLHEEVVNQIHEIYDETSLQHRLIYYYYDETSNKSYFYSRGGLFHSDVYGYYDYAEGHIRIIHGLF